MRTIGLVEVKKAKAATKKSVSTKSESGGKNAKN